MKEIGESFKQARETIGISKEEVIKDLNITESQLDNLEDGNANAFKDVFFLKETIRKYSRYLNLNEEENIDKYNDFIFNYTSRIPIEDILEKKKENKIEESENEENKIVSPYTIKRKKKSNLKYVIIYVVSVIMVILLVTLFVKYLINLQNKNISSNIINEGRYIL